MSKATNRLHHQVSLIVTIELWKHFNHHHRRYLAPLILIIIQLIYENCDKKIWWWAINRITSLALETILRICMAINNGIHGVDHHHNKHDQHSTITDGQYLSIHLDVVVTIAILIIHYHPIELRWVYHYHYFDL